MPPAARNQFSMPWANAPRLMAKAKYPGKARRATPFEQRTLQLLKPRSVRGNK